MESDARQCLFMIFVREHRVHDQFTFLLNSYIFFLISQKSNWIDKQKKTMQNDFDLLKYDL